MLELSQSLIHHVDSAVSPEERQHVARFANAGKTGSNTGSYNPHDWSILLTNKITYPLPL